MTDSEFRVDDLDRPAPVRHEDKVAFLPTQAIESRRPPGTHGADAAFSPEWNQLNVASIGQSTWAGNKYEDSRQGVSFLQNDDRFWVSPDSEHLVVAVMDGLGSDRHSGSEVAADVVRSTLDRHWSEYPADGTVDDAKVWMTADPLRKSSSNNNVAKNGSTCHTKSWQLSHDISRQTVLL